MNLKNIDKDTYFKLSIEDKGIGIETQIVGKRKNIMYALTLLVKELVDDENLSKEAIEFAVKLGLKDEEELKQKASPVLDDIIEKLKKLIKE